MSACQSVCNTNFVDMLEQKFMAKLHENLNLVLSSCKLELIRFRCISLKKFRCCSKFMISITQWYRTKLCKNVPNLNYFKPIILKFVTFLYNSSSKITCNFCIYRGNILPVKGGRKFLPLVFSERTPQITQN